MTIRIDIAELADLEALIAHIDAGEDFVLTRCGQTVATVDVAKQEARESIERIPGRYAHLGPMDDPDIFFRPDPEFTELAESKDERDFYRPPPPRNERLARYACAGLVDGCP
ncbi:hypothetical protein ACRAWD_29005 [Caulobacter segnis]